MDICFKGKRALVTGAASGIGRATVKALHAGGAATVALDIDQDGLDSLKKEIAAIHTVTVDLRDWDATRRAVADIGHVDLLVNSAGAIFHQPFLDVSQEAVDLLFDVNTKAVMNVSQVVARSMVARETGGAIVHMSSQTAVAAIKKRASYSASKAALDALARVMALELGPHQIRVNTVQPTLVMTEFGMKAFSTPEERQDMLNKIPLGKFAEVEDVVNTILFLLSDRAAMITGTTLPIDGGFLAT